MLFLPVLNKYWFLSQILSTRQSDNLDFSAKQLYLSFDANNPALLKCLCPCLDPYVALWVFNDKTSLKYEVLNTIRHWCEEKTLTTHITRSSGWPWLCTHLYVWHVLNQFHGRGRGGVVHFNSWLIREFAICREKLPRAVIPRNPWKSSLWSVCYHTLVCPQTFYFLKRSSSARTKIISRGRSPLPWPRDTNANARGWGARKIFGEKIKPL